MDLPETLAAVDFNGFARACYAAVSKADRGLECAAGATRPAFDHPEAAPKITVDKNAATAYAYR